MDGVYLKRSPVEKKLFRCVIIRIVKLKLDELSLNSGCGGKTSRRGR
jgi:hypothetical protein